MSTLSNSQGLMFAELSTQETKDQLATILKGWFGTQQAGQARATITDAVIACRGVVTQTVGDAILSSFPDAKQAVKAAVDVKLRIAKMQNPAAGMVVRVRIGLAFGPVRVIGGRVSGDAVQTAGTLLGKAKPGEILVDQALKDALGASADVKTVPCGKSEGITVYRIADDAEAAPDPLPSRTPRAQVSPDVAAPERPAAPTPVPGSKPAPAARAGTLVLQYCGTAKRFSPKDGEVSIGRSRENQVRVPEDHVSRSHAKIIWEGETPWLVNLSQNGTCIRFDASGQEQLCGDRTPLEGGGAFALADTFGQSSTGADVVKFSIEAK